MRLLSEWEKPTFQQTYVMTKSVRFIPEVHKSVTWVILRLCWILSIIRSTAWVHRFELLYSLKISETSFTLLGLDEVTISFVFPCIFTLFAQPSGKNLQQIVYISCPLLFNVKYKENNQPSESYSLISDIYMRIPESIQPFDTLSDKAK